MTVLAYVLATLSLLASATFLIRLNVLQIMRLLPKLLAQNLSPLWAAVGLVGAMLGASRGAWAATAMGLVGAGLMTTYAWRCTREHGELERAFGPSWWARIPLDARRRMAKRRWRGLWRPPEPPGLVWERDVPFYTDGDRQVLCDVWRPPPDRSSGLAFVYLHGSGWAMGDKDQGTRSLFRHLAAQGHTVMDVAYRLCPEVDLFGMVGDAKRAVAWIKAEADRLGIDADRVVLGGGSAGAHVALLAGYTPEHPELTPPDLAGADLSVCGLVSFYGPTDLAPGWERYLVDELSRRFPAVPIGTVVDPTDIREASRYGGRLDIFLGGRPDEVPDKYRLANPTTHVGPGSPPTLLFQGNDDFLVPLEGTKELYEKLVASQVPAVLAIYPWTEHAFDLILPQMSPATHSALYDLDRFLALCASAA